MVLKMRWYILFLEFFVKGLGIKVKGFLEFIGFIVGKFGKSL